MNELLAMLTPETLTDLAELLDKNDKRVGFLHITLEITGDKGMRELLNIRATATTGQLDYIAKHGSMEGY